MAKTEIDLSILPVHPGAAAFRMMTVEELQELAEDIRENGQKDPIVLSSDGTQLVDGRNRLEACHLAQVPPTYVLLTTGEDVAKFIASKNVRRRHLTTGQQAMGVVVLLDCSPGEQSRGVAAAAARDAGLQRSKVSSAATVQRWAPEQVEAVIDGAVSLNAAYDIALARKREHETADERAAKAATDLVRLRAAAPDLAELVNDQRMPITEAMAAYTQRERELHEARERVTTYFTRAYVSLWGLLAERETSLLDDWVPATAAMYQVNEELTAAWTAPGLRRLAAALERLAAEVDERRGGIL